MGTHKSQILHQKGLKVPIQLWRVWLFLSPLCYHCSCLEMGSNMDSGANDIVFAIIGHEARRRACTDKWQKLTFWLIPQQEIWFRLFLFLVCFLVKVCIESKVTCHRRVIPAFEHLNPFCFVIDLLDFFSKNPFNSSSNCG